MRQLPIITLLLWGVILTAYVYFQEILLKPEVKFPAIILLTIFITISFWDTQKQGNRFYSLVFAALFLFNTGAITYGLIHNQSLLASIHTAKTDEIDPNMAKLLITGDNEIERQTAARIIYERHGITLPYKAGEDSFKLYVPTKNDRDNFIANQDISITKTQFINNVSQQTVPLLFLLLLQIIIFNGLLLYLILFDQK